MLQDHRDARDASTATDPELIVTMAVPTAGTTDRAASRDRADLQAAVDYILDDCFFSVGQAVGDRKTIEHAALMWWRDRYRAKFLRAMESFGNTWLSDRHRVIAVCRMMGDRAVEYAGSRPTIDLESASKASNDVEQFCVKHAIRRSRRLGLPVDLDRPEMFAGYWCAM